MGNQPNFPGLKEGSVVVITGGSSGLGQELALLLAMKNVRMVITGRDSVRLQKVKQVCQEKGNSLIQTFQGDLTSQSTCKKLVDFVTKRFKRIDFLILNAGVNAHFQFQKLNDLGIYESLMKTNFYANVYLTKYALPIIIKSQGGLVVISSLSGKFGLPSRSAYCASKFALNGFFQSLRTQMKVPILMVYPTSLETPMRVHSLIKSRSTNDKQKREDPKKCAELILKGISKKKQQVYMPWKGWVGVALQPLLPRLIRWKVSQSAKL